MMLQKYFVICFGTILNLHVPQTYILFTSMIGFFFYTTILILTCVACYLISSAIVLIGLQRSSVCNKLQQETAAQLKDPHLSSQCPLRSCQASSPCYDVYVISKISR